ncbi:MAG: hypothetical protein A2W93_01125 [Bacteroidetes bacterium GWF2_43_63]|nr:MAG: hypothetical protein A2W93_01125 [Bacteroidetes bacterium GWF2_43_63]HCB63127.1 hypothetical protein [Bacteroidales bacterium]
MTCAAGQEKFTISIYTLPLFLLDEFPQKLQKKTWVSQWRSQEKLFHFIKAVLPEVYYYAAFI